MTASAERPVVRFYRDPGLDGPPRAPSMRYMIITTARTGSSWLAGVLGATGEAGVPGEYLHPAVLQESAKQMGGLFQLGQFWRDIEPRRTSANGVFGLKLLAASTAENVAQHVRESFIDELLTRYDRFIYLYRRDKVAQAMSLYAATKTGTFQTDSRDAQAQFRQAKTALPFDPESVTGALHEGVRQDAFARRLAERVAQATLTVAYEDLLAAPEAEFGRVFDFLGVTADPATVEAPIYKARDAEMEARTEAFRAWLNGQESG